VAVGPSQLPGDIANWPMLRVIYRTDPSRIADLLPPGITVGSQPTVHVHVYQFPVQAEPEYGVVIKVRAAYEGVDGYFNLGTGIDQEQAVSISHELNGQPKFLCSIDFYRLGAHIVARATHQGYTFVELSGEIGEDVTADVPADFEEHEWWLKYSRAVGGAEKQWDLAPRVVHVAAKVRTEYALAVHGELVLRDSPWDPIAQLLPIEEQVSAKLIKDNMYERSITLAGALDPDAFWPYADSIGNSRWPGQYGGPKERLAFPTS